MIWCCLLGCRNSSASSRRHLTTVGVSDWRADGGLEPAGRFGARIRLDAYAVTDDPSRSRPLGPVRVRDGCDRCQQPKDLQFGLPLRAEPHCSYRRDAGAGQIDVSLGRDLGPPLPGSAPAAGRSSTFQPRAGPIGQARFRALVARRGRRAVIGKAMVAALELGRLEVSAPTRVVRTGAEPRSSVGCRRWISAWRFAESREVVALLSSFAGRVTVLRRGRVRQQLRLLAGGQGSRA